MRLILAHLVGAAVISSIVVLLLPSWYTARTEILPPSDGESSMSLTSLLAGVKVPGVNLPGAATPAETAIAILRSRWVSQRLVEQFGLQKIYDVHSLSEAIDVFNLHRAVTTSDQGTIVLTVEDKNRARSAEMANACIHYLDLFNRENRMTHGKTTRQFVEGRLAATRDTLRAAEESLALYQSSHKAAGLGGGVSDAAQAVGTLLAQRMNLAIKVDLMRQSLAPGNPELLDTTASLRALDAQLSAMPEQGLAGARLFRQVKAYEQLYVLLLAQYEEARIAEARDTPTVDVLDAATAPTKRSRPKRALVVATATVIAGVWSLVLVFGLASLAARARP